jgi:hypothetical protein
MLVLPARRASWQWLLSDDISSGLYHSDVTFEDADGRHQRATEIRLGKGAEGNLQVVLAQNIDRQRSIATSPAPENYLPEGAMDLAIRLVGRHGANTQFALVFDDVSSQAGAVQFGTEIMAAQPGQGVSDGGSVVRVRTRSFGERVDKTYHLDKTGRIAAIDESAGLWWQAATQEEVEKVFPTAGREFQTVYPQQLRDRPTSLLGRWLRVPRAQLFGLVK